MGRIAAWLGVAALAGCAPPPGQRAEVPPPPGPTVAEAEARVAEWIGRQPPSEGSWDPKPRLVDATPLAVERRLGVRVFRLKGYRGSVDEADAYLLTEREVLPLCTGFGGHGLGSMAVGDLDGDGRDELAYTYSWGSGLHRSHLEAVVFEGDGPKRVAAPFVLRNVDLELAKRDGQSVEVLIQGQGIVLGRLVLARGEEGPQLDVQLSSGLADEWRRLIWR